MDANNYLLGYGEKLSSHEKKPGAPTDKKPPYTVHRAKTRLTPEIQAANQDFQALPPQACPDGEVVALLTLHHRYIAKSEYPDKLLQHLGLRTVGRRNSEKFLPENWGTSRPPKEPLESEQLFVAGTKEAFSRWETELPNWQESSDYALQLPQVEKFEAFLGNDKVKVGASSSQNGEVAVKAKPAEGLVTFEIGLHNDFQGDRVLRQFRRYLDDLGAELKAEKARVIGGLTFVPVRARRDQIEEIASFTFVRVARPMPRMRPASPSASPIGSTPLPIPLPSQGPVHAKSRAVIFDGGIPEDARPYLAPWVSYVDSPTAGTPDADWEKHGLAVTSAFLFGTIDPTASTVQQPFCGVDHVRIMGRAGSEEESYDALKIIEDHIRGNPGVYEFVNFSIGPELPIEDNEVDPWTSTLDQLFSGPEMLATAAAGNWGHKTSPDGMNRVQPPGDAVNLLSIGATDNLVAPFARANYSCIGPGRSPGIVKPDGLIFGGTSHNPFNVLYPSRAPSVGPADGTSYAAPFALRSAASIRAHLGAGGNTQPHLSPLAIRTLLIHKADEATLPRHEGGWGSLSHDYLQLITSANDEVLVIYQGELVAGKFLRLRAPLQGVALTGDVEITATLLIAPQVDPESASTYTRSGLEVFFRPDIKDRKPDKKTGKVPAHAKSASFFSPKLGSQPEYVLRKESFKWEPCRKATHIFKAIDLDEPVFDIYYHERRQGKSVPTPRPLPYVFAVTVKATGVPDLYNRVRRAYNSILVPIQPQVTVQIRNT